jgi:hypothetical protein
MAWPTRQEKDGKMDASTTVCVRMETWDDTSVLKGEQITTDFIKLIFLKRR